MKKITVVLIFVILATSLFALSNSQKIYTVDSSIYDDISLVYLASGHALPSTTGPWSGDELIKMIESIDFSEVPQYAREVYNRIYDELYVETSINYMNGGMEFDGKVNVEFYAHTFNKTDINRTDRNGVKETAFAGREWWYGKDLTKITPFFELDWEAYQSDFFYSFFKLGLQNAYHGDKEIGSTAFNTNILGLQNFAFNFRLLDVSIPYRAFAAVGGDGWSVEVGRDRINWGAGETGNLVISDSFPYYDMIRATTYSEKYKYTYLISFFPNKTNYYSKDTGIIKDKCSAGTSSARKMDGIFLYSAHRFEGRFFNDKLTLSLTEAITYEDLEGQIQFAALSPMYFMHNAFISSNSNSTLSLEVDWATPLKGLNLYGQALVDQGSFPGLESAKGPGLSTAESPDAYAFLAGAKYITGLNGGIFKVNAEAAYVGPYTYLRDSGEGFWGLDYVAAVRSRMYAYEDIINGGDQAYDEFVIGYKYGPDCLTGQLKLDYEIGKFDFSFKAFGMLHGAHDRYTAWRKIPANCTEEEYDKDFRFISSTHPSQNYRYNDESKRDAIWKTLDLGLGVSYELTKSIDLFANFDAVFMNNIYNRSGLNAFDAQFIIGGQVALF